MRKAASLFLGTLILAAAPAMASPSADGEAKLAQVLEGRVAGAPVDCLTQRDIRSTRIINRTAIVYETRGGTLYVNRPEAGAQSLSHWDVLVTDTRSPRLCGIDVVHLYDSTARMRNGFVSLGEFIPYRKAD